MSDAVRFEIARALDEIGKLLRIEGASPWRARAYEKGARAIEALTEDLDRVISGGRLVDVPGIGEALAAQIEEIHRTGTSQQLERLRAELPPGVIELSHVLTPKRIRDLWEALGIESVDQLREAAAEGRIRQVRGFGEKTEQQIARAIERYESRPDRQLLVDVLDEADSLVAFLAAVEGVGPVTLAGSARRWKETVGTLRVLATGPADVLQDAFERYPKLVRTDQANGVVTARLASGLPVELHVLSSAVQGPSLITATGPSAHVARLRELGGGELPAGGDEEDVYRALGLPFIPPELRDDPGVIDRALAGERFEDLLALSDIRGMVHCHTTWSDGRHSVEEMAEEAASLGMRYLTITDHSPTAHYAGGVTPEQLALQWAEIGRVQRAVPIRLLRGTESDILKDGSLDYSDELLRRFEILIASIHSRMRMGPEDMTERLVRAMRQPMFKIWGHGLGRLVQRRDPIECDVPRILDAVAESRAAVEINGDPYRLDLPPEHVREARGRGIRFVVSTDAHSRRGMHNLRFGVAMARRAGVRRREVLNALDTEEFVAAVRPGED